MDFLDEQILQLKRKHSDPNYVAPNLQNVIPQENSAQYTDNGNWLEAAGIGASNMVNNLGLGALGQFFGTLGAGVEYISPFSGSKNSDRARLESWGVDPETARQAYPDEDSYLTSAAKGLLEAQNFIGDKIRAWRDEAIGDNPSYGTQVAEGVGSSGGFMLGGVLGTLASGGNPLAGAIISALTEAASESGGTLGDAYRQGLYDNGGLAAANKSFLSNAALNTGLNLAGGVFSPWMSNIRNPLTRYAAQTGGEVLNELVQEPSQQIIEKSAQESLGNGGNFMSALVQNIPEWWDTAKQLAPTVSMSSLITSLLKTGYDMSSAQNRQIVRDQWRNRMFDPQETADSLKAELDTRQRLINQLQREKSTVNDEAKIAAINDSIAKAEHRIAMYQDRLKPGNLDYTPNPYDEFSGKVSPVSTIAGQNTYNTAFKLMEADDIITSHKDDFSVNPNFPQERQIRNRSNSVSQQEVERIAATLDPNALGDNYLAQNGAPVIAEDNTDLSGNGRVLAIRRAYAHHPEQAKKYRQSIIDNAANFGVDPDLAARMEKPVLVRVLLGDNDLAKFATEANSNTIQQLSAGEQAIKDLDIINKSGIIQKFDPLKPLAQQTEVLKDFAAGLQPNERNNFFTDAGQGGISNAGLQRVQDAISAYAYGNSEIIGKLSEAASDISRNVSNALKSLAGRFAHLKATNRGHLDISNDIAQAIQHLDRFRRNKSKSVSEQAAQQNLSGNGQNIDEQLNLSPEAELLLRFFDQFGNQPNTILQGLANYAQLASSQAEDGQQTIDPDLNRDKLSILREALGDKSAQDILPMNSNPQGAQLVHNRQLNTFDEEIRRGKSTPDYADNPDSTSLRPEQVQRNRQAYNKIDKIGLNNWQYQDNSDFDTPLIADISALRDDYANQQAAQKPDTVQNSPNLSDSQGRGNLGSDIGSRSQITNQRGQGNISSELNNDDNSQFSVPQYADISSLSMSEMNNDEEAGYTAAPVNKRQNPQQEDNSQLTPKSPANTAQDYGNVQNRQTPSEQNNEYMSPEVIRTKDGDIHTPGAFVRRSYIPSVQAQIKKAAQTGKNATRYFFVRRGEKDTSAPTRNSPEQFAYDANLTAYDGYIGDILTGAGDNSAAAHAFYGTQDGVHYVGFTDADGNFVATYNMNDDSFFINEGSEKSGLARRIEDDFRRQFGKNPVKEIIRRLVMHKAINAGENDTVADAASRIYIAMNENLASQTGISLLDMAMADNLMIQKINRQGDNGDRGKTQISTDMGFDGNPVFEAQNVVSLFKNSDASSLIHEFWHIYQEKIKRLGNAGLIKKGSQLWQDWQTIKREGGLLQADFTQKLSPQEQAKWVNSQEKNAASFEKYFRQGKAPEGISAQMRNVFNNFKDWLSNIYRKIRDIFYTNSNGRYINNFSISDDIRKVFDHILLTHGNVNFNNDTQQAQTFTSYSDPQGFQEFRQSGLDPQGWFSRKWHSLKNWAGNLIHSAARIGLPKSPTDWRSLPFPNQEIQDRILQAMKPAPKLGMLGRMRQAVRDIAESVRSGDYSDITSSPRKNDPNLRLNEALQAFRNLGRQKISEADKAVKVMRDIIRPLNQKQRELLNTYTVIRDIAEQIREMPGSALSFGLTEQDARNMNAKLSRMVDEDEQVRDAVKRLDDSRNAQVEEFKKQAHALDLNFDDVFHYKDYFRRRVIQYLETARSGKRMPSAQGNLDIQDRYTAELREIMGRSFFKKRKGTTLDYITDYVQANAEVRAQLAQDIETMKTLRYIKEHHDIAPRLRKKHGIKSQQIEIDFDNSQTFSQSGEEGQLTLFDVIPDGYEAFDPSATRLIETAQSAPENLLHMIANDIAEQHGVPLDDMLERLGIQNDGNIMVIPTEIANTLRKMAKARHRGMLGQAAKDFTTWWKRSVIFTPIRNMLYNIRNFTGDLDALIAGNPKALRHLPRAVRELTGWFTHHGKEGYEASQDLQDYIRLSGTLGIQSLNLTQKDAQAILDFFPVPEKTKKRADKEAARLDRNTERAQALQDEQDPGMLKKAAAVPLGLIRKFFKAEHDFTEWREHLLRYAAYLEYKQQMESNKEGRPSNWGASIEEEVMSVKDIKERAFKMSNELLGAYDQVSEVGKQLRDILIPFYSWMEVNMRRTYRLLRNGFKYGYGARQVKQLGVGKLAAMPLYAVSAAESVSKLMALTLAMQMFNRLVPGIRDADDDLPNDVKYRPHVTLGSSNGRTYYFDRIGAVADVLDWASLDSAWLDAKDFANGQKSLGSWLKQIVQAPFSKVINGLNPAIKMPIELAMGRSMFPNAFNPSTIRDPAEYVARSFGLAWPYKAVRGIPHSNAQEASKFFIYSQDTNEAAYWQTLDRVRQFQNEVLDKHFDGFASTRRGRALANIKKALRYNDGQAVRRFLKEYYEADGSKQGLKNSIQAMNPLHGLSEKEKAQFMRWISADDRKYLRKAEKYFHQLADRFTR